MVPYWDYPVPMRIVAIGILREFWDAHPDAEHPLKAWVREARAAQWKTPHEVKAQFRHASVLANRRIVFNIKGNDYRLVVAVDFEKGIVWIKWIGTHKAYDKIDVAEVRYGN